MVLKAAAKGHRGQAAHKAAMSTHHHDEGAGNNDGNSTADGDNKSDGDNASSYDSIEARFSEFFDQRRVIVAMASLTVFVLWGDDLRLYAFPKSADNWFYTLFLLAFLVFFVEFMGNTICKQGYKNGFFFWLDLVATFSLLVDIPWVLAIIETLLVSSSGGESGAASINSTVATVRTARAVRLVRLIRLVRVVKLWSMVRKAKESDLDEKLQAQARDAANAKQAALKRVEASRLGKLLSEMTTRRVVVMVLMMLFVLPFLDATDLDNSKLYGLSLLFWYGRSGCGYDAFGNVAQHQLASGKNDYFACEAQTENWLYLDGWRNLVYLYSSYRAETEGDQDPLLWLRIPNWSDGGKLADVAAVATEQGSWQEHADCGRLWAATEGEDCPFRKDELQDVIYLPPGCFSANGKGTNCVEIFAIARFDRSAFSREQAGISMMQTCFVCLLLGTMSVQFQNDTQSLVIAPIEKMVNIIKQLAEDPLEPPNLDEDDPGAEGGEGGSGLGKKRKKSKGPQLETTMLENTILKIGGLLQVGFGEAGAKIIGNNMMSGDGELNIMMPGSRVESVFGFVDIRQFTDTTECLEEDVMVFVNSIGHIVHKCVHRWSGVANKNIGDAFLVLWKIDREEKNSANSVSDMADRSLFAFLKIICETKRSARIKAFASHPKIVKRFGPNHEVCRFGLGLHVGWAIEGPIGSDFKVDASYLSPHVNISMQLEGGTKTYGVPILLSEPLYLLLSLKAKQRCRKIDMIGNLGGGMKNKPGGLYTFPMNSFLVDGPPVLTSAPSTSPALAAVRGSTEAGGGGAIITMSGESTTSSREREDVEDDHSFSSKAGGGSESEQETSATYDYSPQIKNLALIEQGPSLLLGSGDLQENQGYEDGSNGFNFAASAQHQLNFNINSLGGAAAASSSFRAAPGDVWKPEGLDSINTDLIEERDGVEFLFILDRDLLLLQKNVPGYDPDDPDKDKIRSRLRKALSSYIAGDWRSSREEHENLLKEFGTRDRATLAVYDYMKSLDFVCPSNWKEVYRKF